MVIPLSLIWTPEYIRHSISLTHPRLNDFVELFLPKTHSCMDIFDLTQKIVQTRINYMGVSILLFKNHTENLIFFHLHLQHINYNNWILPKILTRNIVIILHIVQTNILIAWIKILIQTISRLINKWMLKMVY